MHVYVQKSTRTTFPRSSSAASGSELSQPVAPPKRGQSALDGKIDLRRVHRRRYLKGRNAARTSVAKISGSSQAAKCPPLSGLL